jgi:hypothetical protein
VREPVHLVGNSIGGTWIIHFLHITILGKL